MRADSNELSNSASNFNNLEYVRTMGSYKPKFEGIPEDYFPLTCCEIIKYSIFVFSLIGGSLGIMIGFTFWVINGGL